MPTSTTIGNYVALPDDDKWIPPTKGAKGKRVAPRDREQRIPPTPAQLEAARIQRAEEAALYSASPPQLQSGHTLWLQIHGATIQGGEIHINAVVHGMVVRPEGYAESTEQTISIVVPAKVYGGE